MMLCINLLLAAVLLFMVFFVIRIITETIKLCRNPVPGMQNHDKHFS